MEKAGPLLEKEIFINMCLILKSFGARFLAVPYGIFEIKLEVS